MRTLDLNSLTVESFQTVDGDAPQWLIIAPTTGSEDEMCGNRLYEGAETIEHICSTT